MNKLVLLIGLVGLLGGCSQLTARAAPKLAKAINTYCEEPQDSRMALRSQVNALIAPNSVQVNCAADVSTGGVK